MKESFRHNACIRNMGPIVGRGMRGGLLLCCIFMLFIGVRTAGAAEPVPFSGSFMVDQGLVADASKSQWKIEAAALAYDQKRDLYEAEGDVKITSGDRIIQADRAALDMTERKAELWGNVFLKYGKNWLKGSHVTWNLDSETGWVDDGIVFFDENKFFVQGRNITKSGPNRIDAEEGYLTTCDPAKPDWKIRYQNMNVEVGGYAWARNISMWAGPVPVAFLPIVGVPVQKERQSGVLLPWAGYSDLLGYDFEIPYYWVIRDDMDATFYGRYMSERGFMGGAEFQINNPDWGKGVWMFNYLSDQVDKSLLAEQGYPFETRDRFWARARHDVQLPWNVSAKIDIDLVSDKNFLQEFWNGSTSFSHSERIFQQYFGRGSLYDWTSLVRESSIYMEKRGESDLLTMDLRYFQQLQDAIEPTTVQKLPGFTYTVIPKWVGGSNLYYALDSSAVNYYRREGDREQRLDFSPRIYYPMHWSDYINVEPSTGFRSSSYIVEWDNKNFDNFNQRAVSDTSIEVNSRVNRVFPVSFGNTVAFQHTFRPEIAYEYAAQAIYGHIPQLDRLDHDLSRNGIRYGFTTFLTAKDVVNDAWGNPVTTYREWARLRAFQFYNVEKPMVEDPFFTTRVMDEGLSPVGLRFDLMPIKYITLSYDADFDLRSKGDGNSHDFYATLDSGKGQILRVDYQRRSDLAINEITTAVLVKALPNVYLNAYYDYFLEQGYLYQQGYGLKYVRGCWGVGLAFERIGEDNRFVMTIDLLGLGSIGRSINTAAMK